MSIAIIVTVIAFIGALIGSILGYYINLRIARGNREDSYIFAVLPERLKAHQKEFDLAWDFNKIAREKKFDKDYSEYLTICEN